MGHLEIPGLPVAAAGLALLARVSRVPYPIFPALGDLFLGFALGVPDATPNPDLAPAIFLPPLLYAAASFSLRDPRANARRRRVERDLDLEESRLEA